MFQFYPAKLLKFSNDRVYCNVEFYDGYRKRVKVSVLQKAPDDYSGVQFPGVDKTQEKTPALDAVVDPVNHNKFVCDTCNKGFRKEKLLQDHKKHYHNKTTPESSTTTRSHERKSDPNVGKSVSKNVVESNVAALPEEAPTVEMKVENVEESSIKEVPNLKVKLNLNMLLKAEQASSSDDSSTTTELLTPNTFPVTPNSDIVNSAARRRGKGKRSHSSFGSNLKRSWHYDPTRVSNKKPKPNLSLPFFDAKQMALKHENDNIEEVVKCICSIAEENGLMVQCEHCLYWQHALCMNFKLESDVPDDGYVSVDHY